MHQVQLVEYLQVEGHQVVNTIDYIEIMTTGNALDFGDLTNGRRNTEVQHLQLVRFLCRSDPPTL